MGKLTDRTTWTGLGAAPSSTASVLTRPAGLAPRRRPSMFAGSTATLVVTSWCAAVAAGCGGPQGSPEFAGSQAGVIEAPAPGAPRYDTTSTDGAVVGDAHADAVRRGIEAAAARRDMPMEGDGRLGILAAWIAERLGEGGRLPPHEVVEFFTRHLGLVEPVPNLLMLGQPDASMLEEGVRDGVVEFLEQHPYNRYGAAVVARQGLTVAVIALSARWLDLSPMARSVGNVGEVELSGRLLGRFGAPTVAVTTPEGSVEHLAAGDGPAFSLPVPLPRPGVYRIEVLGAGAHGNTVMANFPVYVGEDPPTSVVSRPYDARSGRDAEAVSHELLRLINESRAERGLPPVLLHEGTAAVAVAHSRDMVDNGFVGHESPSTGTPAQRLERAGIQSGLVLENIGRGYGPEEIHRGLLESPGHRAHIFNADVTHVGIGVVAAPEGDQVSFTVTEVFVLMASAIDVGQGPPQVLAAINRARRARGAAALEIDGNLARAAQSAAEEFFEDPGQSQQDVVDSASAGLRRFSIAFQRVAGLMVVVDRLEDAGQLEPTFDRDVRYVGIGVAQGTRPDTRANSIAVVILLAWPR